MLRAAGKGIMVLVPQLELVGIGDSRVGRCLER